ncbi:PAS domain S-box protein [Phormidium sp. FACHB-1136]|uniref:hybrid sensor histidine kinase/response regulator n=1 Tax=Phormidium sp. FACHB-1136 TaxID=2692848 RepID=UPI001683CAD5|nr:PAS domain S-box protein [Phormidium sp. FACHB-1136]MBD2426800.1 PAS domain S-box protein [Phormidium sp. FACHB-1136]
MHPDFTDMFCGDTQTDENGWINILLANQSPLTKVFDALPVAIGLYTVPPNARILYVNARFTRLFGYTINDLPSIDTWITLGSDDTDPQNNQYHRWLRLIDNVQTGQRHANPEECRIQGQDGGVKTILLNATLLGDCILSSFIDITDIKQKEQELSQITAEYMEMLDKAPIAIASYNLKDNPEITFINHQFKNIFAYDLSEIATVNQWFERAYPDLNYRQEVSDQWQALIARQKATGKTSYLPCKVTNKSGKTLNILFGAITLDNKIIVTIQDLTTLKNAESELEEARQNLAKTALAITEAIPVGTYTMVKRPDQPMAYFSFMSERFLELTGLDRKTAESDPLKGFACVHPDEYDDWVALNAEAFAKKIPFYGETRLLIDGEIRWISAESIPRDLPDGSTVWEGVLTDITKTKHYEAELKQAHDEISQMNRILENKVRQRTAELEANQAKFQRLLNDISDKFLVFSHTDSILTYVSHSVEHIFGIRTEDILGKPWMTAVNWLPEYLEVATTEVDRMLRDKNDAQLEMSFIRPDGERRTVNILQHAVWDDSGSLVAIEGLVEDITERKTFIAALEESEAKYRTFIETANDLIYSINTDGTFAYLSPNTEDLLGFKPEELQGLSFPEVLHPDDVAHCQEFFAAVMAGEKKRGLEYRVIHKDGNWRWHMTSASPQFNDQGEVIAFLGFAYDITERKLADIKQQQLTEELIKASRLKDEFMAMMSHELRTPLNAILGMTEILQEGIYGEMNLQQGDALNTIENSGQHLLNIINDILDVAKIESEKLELNLQNVAVAPLCESSLALVEAQALKKSIQLRMSLPFQIPRIHVDEGRIRQVLLNLLNNAVKFTPDHGQVTLEVIYPPVSANQAPNHLRLAVKDTGIGIAPENVDRLFQPFVQIDSALNRQHEGTGLGLTLVKKIVDLHGGKVAVTSEVGVGSCFTVDVPIVSESALHTALTTLSSSSTNQPQQRAIEGRIEHLPSPLILLAEDNLANGLMVKNYLEIRGCQLVIAHDGEQAVALAMAECPDLMIMDIQMPKLNGIEAIKAIRSHPPLQHTPIIALTALVMEGDREKCLYVGANEYLSKPVRLKQLWMVIEHLLSSPTP